MSVAVACIVLILLPPARGVGAAADLLPPGKTFASAMWGLALDYPDDWAVDDDGEEVRFRSADGSAIVLGRTGTDRPSEPARGSRAEKPPCTTTTNAHDVVSTVCVDPASMARRAVLVLKTRDGRQSRVAISTRIRDSRVFDALVASARAYP